ncbi:PEPxxWA-CTERM sorting domain-containing protein [Phenylobacterium sp.]|jgi:hypothetical protein|uniref:PEPxxWA-CTERM sorting domain-containing protein n=1 Tax=Phenylobacterium sp. TaxID=1871053 RepID=UPI002F429ED4
MAMKAIKAALAATILLGAASAAQAAGTPISIQNDVNSNLYTYTGGLSYPAAGSTVTIGGVDFTLASFFPPDFNAPDVGVIQSGDGSPTSINIATPNVTIGATTTFYSLVNSAFGVATNTVGDLTLNFAGGATFVYDLTEGDNLRDHFNGSFNISAPNVYGTATFSDDRLDAQQIVLPGSYVGDVLTSITLNNTQPQFGNPFLAAFTVVDPGVGGVPEPAAWALMLTGFAGLGAMLRRHRRQAALA